MRFRRAVLLSLVLTLVTTSPLLAQATTATLKGKILDVDNVGLPGVPVRVSSNTHGVAGKTVISDVEGRFRFQLLPPANDYFLYISYPGFGSMDVGPIDLDPGRTTVQDIVLRSSEEMTEHLTVVGTGKMVDTESTKSASTFNTEFLDSLPIIGQSYQNILTLTPGVTDTDGDGNPNVQGTRETGLQIRVDGGNVTDPVSGTFGQNLNLEAIEEMEVITAGASAEYGRADGGFANVITKSGGNDFEGSLRLLWRGRILDGDGAAENQDTFVQSNTIDVNTRDIRSFLTLGGALKQDKLWYFLSFQRIDQSIPLNLAGASIETTQEGWNNFGKLTWQVDSDNKLAFQVSSDPRTFTGLFVGFGTTQSSDALWEQGGGTAQLRWTSIISPTLLLETLVSRFDTGIAITPVSSEFRESSITTRVNRSQNRATLQAVYPTELCSIDGELSGFVPNCDPSAGALGIYQIDLINGTTTGPFPFQGDDERIRNAIKSDLTYTIDDAMGEHQLKAGLEFSDEKFSDSPITNPLFLNNFEPCPECRDQNGNPIPNAVRGLQLLNVPTPTVLDLDVVGFSSAAYITDTWKPRPNLTIQAGVRLDREDVDTRGFLFFDPKEQKRESMDILEGLCADALRVARAGGVSNANQTCDVNGRIPGTIGANLEYTFDSSTPDQERKYDLDGDGRFDSGSDGQVWLDTYTAFPDRIPENFEITNMNLSPRLSFSWDPWADGRSKVFSTWGRFYDRLFLTTVDDEMGPDLINFTFEPDPTTQTFSAGMPSRDVSAVSVTQVDRNLQTPYTDVFTLGFERELVAEWSAKVTYTQRLGYNLLQDQDINHIQCEDFDDEFGIPPSLVCADSGALNDDLFGNANRTPNNAPDLYNVNPNFNQVLRIGNFNSSNFRSLSLELNKRLHRNWQMQTSYTYSRAKGQAENFQQGIGNDPSTRDDEEGYLAFDQRHRVLVIATTRLPRDVELGGTVTWESGTPFSVQAQAIDEDDVGNTTFRTFFPTRQRNDQRNDGFWGVDLKLVKRFVIGKMQAAAEVSVQNLLNQDDLTLAAFQTSSFNGVQLVQGPQGLRRFGRFWEAGFSLHF